MPPPQAASNIASVEMTAQIGNPPRVAELNMAFPRNKVRGRTHVAAKRKTAVGAMTPSTLRPDGFAASILYQPQQRP